MTLSGFRELVQELIQRLKPAINAHYETRGLAFYPVDAAENSVTVFPLQGEFRVEAGVKAATQVIRAPLAVLVALLEGEPIERDHITFLPDDNRLYMPPPFRPLVAHLEFDQNAPFPMPHRYPVVHNLYIDATPTTTPLPTYDNNTLPELIADKHPAWVAMYDYAWQTAFHNLQQPRASSGFIANFIDTAFNDNTFLWDSCFMTMFGRYGRQVFDFMGTLDNFYAKQHADGFICREISTITGNDLFLPHDARATGPNIFAWTEWLDFQLTRDSDRLRAVFPALVAYHHWWQDWQRWPDGTYWTSGLGSGMDNQTRVPDSREHHRFYAWLDATAQQALSCRMLLQMADVLEWHEFDAALHQEYTDLQRIVNATMWDETRNFYFDRAPDGTLSSTKTIGAFWTLLAAVVPQERASRLIAHLHDPASFNRPHRVPSQSAEGDYRPDGDYWRGGVWSPTNYMILQALSTYGENTLAHEIALNHVEAVASVFGQTKTLWETYAPESRRAGSQAKPNFVGWTGLSAITIPIEYLIGLRQQHDYLLWDIRLTEQHGVLRFPLAGSHTLDVICAARTDPTAPPTINLACTTDLKLQVQWGVNQTKTYTFKAGQHEFSATS